MSTICPNCSRPQRKDAKYCGFCGANLTPVVAVKSVAASVTQGNPSTSQVSAAQKPPKPKRFTTNQKVTYGAIILLILLIIMSVICRYWSEIAQSLVQMLFSLYLHLTM
jgi:uncharacterized membrane protein YvbJ